MCPFVSWGVSVSMYLHICDSFFEDEVPVGMTHNVPAFVLLGLEFLKLGRNLIFYRRTTAMELLTFLNKDSL